MDQSERRVIDDLFTKLQTAEGQSGPRDAEAEASIRGHLERQPAAPYYMAQAIVVQQDALSHAQGRIQQLERELAERPAGGGGGFLSGLFGGGQPQTQTPPPPPQQMQSTPARSYPQAGGGGFLAGAAQTAMGVAGGFLIADALSSLFATDPAAAAEADPGLDPMAEDGPGAESGVEEDPFIGDAGDVSGGAFDAGGDFDF